MRTTLTSKLGRAPLSRCALLAGALITALQSMPASAGLLHVVRPRVLCENIVSRGDWLQNMGRGMPAIVDVEVEGNPPGTTWLGAWAGRLAPDYQILVGGSYRVYMEMTGNKTDLENPRGVIQLPKGLASANAPSTTLEFRHKDEIVYTLPLESGTSRIRGIAPMTPLTSVEFGESRGNPSRYDFRVTYEGCVPEGFMATVEWEPAGLGGANVSGLLDICNSDNTCSLALSIAASELLKRPPELAATDDAFPARLTIQAFGDPRKFEWPLGQLEFTANATPNRLDLGKKTQETFPVEVRYHGGRGILNGAANIALDKGGPAVGGIVAIEKTQPGRVPFTTAKTTWKVLHFDIPREVALMGVLRSPQRIWLVVEDHYKNKVELPLGVVNVAPDEEAAARAKYANLAPPKATALATGRAAVNQSEGSWCDNARLVSAQTIGRARHYEIAARCHNADRVGTVRSADTVVRGMWDPDAMNAVLGYDYYLGWRVMGSQKYRCDRDPWVRGPAPQCTHLESTGSNVVLALVGVGLAQPVAAEQRMFARPPAVSSAQPGQPGGIGNAQVLRQAAPPTQNLAALKAPVPGKAGNPLGINPTGQSLKPQATMESDTNRYGGDYANREMASAQQCQAACDAAAQCRAWTWVKPAAPAQAAASRLERQAIATKGMCWLKSRVAVASRDECCVSGVK